MGGLVLDIVIAYLIKSAPALALPLGNNRWKLVQARVDSSWLGGGSVWNCPTAQVAYTYEFGRPTYSAIDSKPFLIETSAKGRVERYPAGEAVIVRVNPIQLQKSVLKQADQ